uniref:Eukaryotic translation initiation factor 3 subunit 6 n=1 Tax=Arundo donax TaxID=35708 RepID=A0A0A9GI41_ARUDO
MALTYSSLPAPPPSNPKEP